MIFNWWVIIESYYILLYIICTLFCTHTHTHMYYILVRAVCTCDSLNCVYNVSQLLVCTIGLSLLVYVMLDPHLINFSLSYTTGYSHYNHVQSSHKCYCSLFGHKLIVIFLKITFDFCRFCLFNRFFHPRHNGQWPPTSKDFLSQILSITFIFLSYSWERASISLFNVQC